MPKVKKDANINAHNAAFELVSKKFSEGLLGAGVKPINTQQFIPTGDIALDYILGGGLWRKRIVTIAATEGAGKTSTCLRTIATAQGHVLPSFKCDRSIIYIDAEYALNTQYAENMGVEICYDLETPHSSNAMFIYYPDDGETALEYIYHACQAKIADIIIVDSKDALLPQVEIETAEKKGFAKQPQSARQADMFSRWLRLVTPALGKSDTALLFVSQLREKVGQMFGNPETESGGRGLKYYASARIHMTSGSKITDSHENIIGKNPSINCVKNKMAPPFRKSSLFSMNNVGIDVWRNLVEKGIAYGFIEKSGTGYVMNEQRFSKEKLITYFKDNPTEYEKYYNKTMNIMLGTVLNEDSVDICSE